MSRSFSRKVEKNKKWSNEQRKKKGLDLLNEVKSEKTFVGRSWLLPSFLAAMLTFYLILFNDEMGFMFWFTVIGYILLILFLFFLKRPYLVVGKDFVETRRFGGVYRISAEDIDNIVTSNDSINISFKIKRASWSFTSLLHRMDILSMSNELQIFSDRNQLNFERKEK